MRMRKRILIISYYFAPQNVIGAVRPTKIAKYLHRMGYDVTVLCSKSMSTLQDPLLQRDMAELSNVITVRERSLFRLWKERALTPETPRALTDRAVLPADNEGVHQRPTVQESEATPSVTEKTKVSPPQSSQAKPREASIRKRLLNALYIWLFERGDASFARACTYQLLKANQHYDIVLSCYGPISVHTIARRAKRLHIADRWIADFRDETSVPFSWQKAWLERYMRRIRKNADLLTVVSGGFIQMMQMESFARLIPNGYDTEDIADIPVMKNSENVLSFAYCGQLYAGHSDVTPVFEAVRALIDLGSCDKARFRFHYAGRQGEAFIAQAAAYGLADAVVDHGMLPRARSLALQRAVDVLMMATWNTPERKGVITGKVLEYMMADRPVVCTVSGSIANSDAAALVESTGLGVGYEQAHANADATRLQAFIKAMYDWRFAGAQTPFHPDRAQIDRYAYPRIVEQIAELIENV